MSGSERATRLRHVIAGETHEGREGLYLKLPLETFLHCISYLLSAHSDIDLIHTTHVCSAWRQEIIASGKLWTKLNGVDVGSLTS